MLQAGADAFTRPITVSGVGSGDGCGVAYSKPMSDTMVGKKRNTRGLLPRERALLAAP